VTRNFRAVDLGGARAIILHRPHPSVTALTRQLEVVGLTVTTCWPELSTDALAANFVFFDADMGFDKQFPWASGQAPMPLIALIGSEAPGRIEWALSTGANAQILKPVGSSGVYSAILIAHHAFEERRVLSTNVGDLRHRLAERQTVVQAVVHLMTSVGSEHAAYAALRAEAMAARISIEDAAARIVSRRGSPTQTRPKGGAL
jgi:response regulator NasT